MNFSPSCKKYDFIWISFDYFVAQDRFSFGDS